MATTGESKSENEEFLGFDEEAQVAVFQPREEEYLPAFWSCYCCSNYCL